MADIPDDASTTTQLNLGGFVDSDLTSDDLDLIRINLTADQRYRFDLFGSSSGLGYTLADPGLLLLDAQLLVVAVNDDSGTGLDARIDYTAPQSGVFYLATLAADGGIGTYRLAMTTAIQPPDDFGQTPRTASNLTLGAARSGTISYDGDQDWFAIGLTAGQTYEFNLRADANSASPLSDAVLSIYGSDGSILASNDDASGSTLDSQLIFTAQTNGTYYLGAGAIEAVTGAYLLTGAVTVPDIPDSIDTTVTLAIGGSIDSTIGSADDIDAIRVQLVAGQQYVIDMRGAPSGAGLTLADPALLLVDSAVQVVAQNDDNGTSFDSRISFTAASSGSYYIAAFAADGGTGSYRVSIQAVGGQPGVAGAADDFNGDRFSDILFQNVDGSVSTWSSLGIGFQQNSYFANVAPSWNVVESFDMTGDGRADILWRNTDGTVAAWQANGSGMGTAFNQASYLASSPGAQWKIAATGDIDGDNRDDILWRNDDGSISTWSSTGTSFQQNSYFHASVGTSWKVEGLGDFNGDGRDDILWRNDNGAISEWLSNGTGFAENSYFDNSVPSSWHVDGIADLNGDGRDDLVWRNDNGALSTWLASGTGFVKNAYFTAGVGNDWQIAQTGDYNADGRADLLWRNAGGAISVWQSNGTGFDQNTIFSSGPATTWQIQAHEFAL